MSAIGPKQTWACALHMSAFGGEADMTVCRCPLSRSLLGVKQTWVGALHMSAFDPKQTLGRRPLRPLSDLLCCNHKWQRAGLGTATCAGEISSKLLLDRRSRARIWRGRSKTHEQDELLRSCHLRQLMHKPKLEILRSYKGCKNWDGRLGATSKLTTAGPRAMSTMRANTHQNWSPSRQK